MEPKPQSEQERLMRLFAAHSLGAANLFIPDKHRKGKRGTNERADLMWVGHDCAVLFFMTARKRHGDPEKDAAKFADARQHNLDQAIGSLRLWREGFPIVGRNDDREFTVAIDTFRHTIILLVIDSGATISSLDERDADALGVTMVATMAQGGVEILAKAGAGPIDLVLLARMLGIYLGGVGESEFKDLARAHIETSAHDAGVSLPVDAEVRDTYLETFRNSTQLRREHGNIWSLEQGSLMADLPLTDLMKLAHAVVDAERKVLAHSSQMVIRGSIRLTRYRALVIAGLVWHPRSAEVTHQLLEREKKEKAAGQGHNIIVMYDTYWRNRIWALTPIEGESELRRILDVPR